MKSVIHNILGVLFIGGGVFIIVGMWGTTGRMAHGLQQQKCPAVIPCQHTNPEFAPTPDDIRPRCFTRYNQSDGRYYLAQFHSDGESFAWAGSWDTLTYSVEAARILNCRLVVDPTKGY